MLVLGYHQPSRDIPSPVSHSALTNWTRLFGYPLPKPASRGHSPQRYLYTSLSHRQWRTAR